MSGLVRSTAAIASWVVCISMAAVPSGVANPQGSEPLPRDETVRIRPGLLPKGAPLSHPRLVGTTIRDRGFRRDVRAVAPYHAVWMRGATANGYLLAAQPEPGDRPHLWYVPRHGGAEHLRTGAFDLNRISASGRVAAFHDRHRPERVQIRTIPGNRTIARYVSKRRGGWVDVLDMRGRRALLGIGSKVAWLDPRSNGLRPVVRRTGWWASARHNLLLTDEPRAKGGFAMVRLDSPRTVLWRRGLHGSVPLSISADGRYLMTWLLSGGDPMPGRLTGIQIRRARDGAVVRRFRGRELGWDFAWVGKHHRFLVPAEGARRTAMVRCRAAGRCERVGRTVPTRPGMSPSESLGVSFRGGFRQGLPLDATFE